MVPSHSLEGERSRINAEAERVAIESGTSKRSGGRIRVRGDLAGKVSASVAWRRQGRRSERWMERKAAFCWRSDGT